VLTITLDEFYWFEKDPVAGTLRGVVKYTLSRDAAPDSVTIRFFGPDLEELEGAACPLEEQPYTGGTVGTHLSDVYELNVDYDENDELIEPVYCVVYAEGRAADAANNRDAEPKPALQKGSSVVTPLLANTSPRGAVMISTLHDVDPEPPDPPTRYPLAEQTEDREVVVTAHWDDDLVEGKTIHFAVFDPPDMSPYVSDPEDWDAIWRAPGNWGDDENGGDNGGGCGSVSPQQVVAVEDPVTGKATASTTLTITNQYAGDNYVVVGAIESEPTVAMAIEEFNGGEGHLLVAWARKYYTVGQMCKGGSELTANALVDDTEINVADPGAFSVGDAVVIFGYHSPAARAGEQRTVSAVGQGTITLDAPLQLSYYGSVFRFGTPRSYLARVADGMWELPSGWSNGLATAYGDMSLWRGVEVPGPGEQYNGGCFTDWKWVGDTLRLPKLANPRLLEFGRAPEFRQRWAWHPPAGEDDHDYVGVCQRAELAHYQPQGMTAVDTHMSFVFVESCVATQVSPGRTAAHELGHFMGVRDEESDNNHPTVLSHPFDHEAYGPTFPEDHGCLMDYKADMASAYCEFCVHCIEIVREAGPR